MHFEYTNYWEKDEEIFRNAQNMIALRIIFKKNITTVGGKGKVVEQLNKQEEEAAKKRQEEAHRLAQEVEEWLRA